MKIFRYKVKFNTGKTDETRIISVGVKTEKEYISELTDISYIVDYNPEGTTLKHINICYYNYMKEGVTPEGKELYRVSYKTMLETKKYKKIHYTFAFNILAPFDTFDIEKEQIILAGRLAKYGRDFTLPKEFYSYGLLKTTAFSYCKAEFQEWCDTRGIKDKFTIEEYVI